MLSIEKSHDLSEWSPTINSSLHAVNGKSCEEIKSENFEVDFLGRYLRFTALDYYGKGAGLQFISWKFNTENHGKVLKIFS